MLQTEQKIFNMSFFYKFSIKVQKIGITQDMDDKCNKRLYLDRYSTPEVTYLYFTKSTIPSFEVTSLVKVFLNRCHFFIFIQRGNNHIISCHSLYTRKKNDIILLKNHFLLLTNQQLLYQFFLFNTST